MAVGGAQKVLLQLAAWFHQRGYRVMAVFFYDRDHLAETWRADYPFPVEALGSWQKESWLIIKGWNLMQSVFRLFGLMREEHFSSVLTFTHHSNLLALPLAWLAGIPVRIASHRGRIFGFPDWQARMHAWIVNAGFATALVAVSPLVRQQSIEEGVRPEKIVVIPNGVNLPEISPDQTALIRQEAALDEDAFLILTAGRLWAEKGHVHLIRAMPEVVRSEPKVILALAGEGALRPELEVEARKLNVETHIRFLGMRSDVLNWMSAADLFVLPSNSEGMPNALLEAMGLGLPVIATRVGGVPDIIQDGQTGCLVPPQNPPALAAAIISLLRSPQERSRLGQNAREMVRREFQMEKMCERYRSLLDPIPDEESNGSIS